MKSNERKIFRKNLKLEKQKQAARQSPYGERRNWIIEEYDKLFEIINILGKKSF